MSDLKQIISLADRMQELEEEVAEAELSYKNKAEELRQVTENDLPEAMEALGLEQLKLANGRIIKLHESLHPGIPKDKQAQAYAWLRDNGHDSIIKRDVNIKFGKGEGEEAEGLLAVLTDMGLDFNDKESVHHSTLGAFVRELLAQGEELPDCFSVHRRLVVKST